MQEIDKAVALAGQKSRRCQLTFKEFFNKFPPAPNYLWGRHTEIISRELQRASDAVIKGECAYVIINVPPRHGKSDLCSRSFPPYHLSREPNHEVILGTYGADLSEDLSHAARKRFQEAGPTFGLRLSDDRNQIGAWRIEGHRGGMYAIGLGGAITGRGAHVLIIDDYCKNREQAESETIRQSVWDSFRSDLMTRLAPAHAVIIVATRWHEDDLVGRILKEIQNEPKFPRFKVVNIPAQAEDGTYLFTDRFPAAWYESQRAAVGPYAWQSLYQGDPRPRHGHLLRADLVAVVEKMPEGLRWVRGWDLASTDKERIKDDPDFTVGTRAAYHGGWLYVADVVRGQWSAPKRDQIIVDTAKRDGSAVTVRLECVAGYKDAYSHIRAKLFGVALVRSVIPKGDKVTRAAVMEPVFEAGRVRIQSAPWNSAWKSEFLGFPKGRHDDQVDSLQIAAGDILSDRRQMKVSL